MQLARFQAGEVHCTSVAYLNSGDVHKLDLHPRSFCCTYPSATLFGNLGFSRIRLPDDSGLIIRIWRFSCPTLNTSLVVL